MSAEMATSPASFAGLRDCELGEVDGNDNTSVALFWLRNWRFRERRAALLVTSTFTVACRPTARRARNTKRSSVSSLNPATFFCRITKSFSLASSLAPAANRWRGTKANRRAESRASRPLYTVLSLGFGRRRFLLVRSRCCLLFGAGGVRMPGLGQQEHLLLGDARLVLVVGANDALHQMMADHVGF